jgi:hypothetical protein
MVQLGASAIARKVGRDLVFAASCRAAYSHSDFACADGAADALPARQPETTRLRCWHTRASVWIATSFRSRPRMHEHENAWWSLQLHLLCAPHSRPALARFAVRPVYVQETHNLY